MVHLKISRLEISPMKLIINPYRVLGIKKNSSKAETKSIFRKKLNEAGDNYLLKAQICLAYDIIVNREYYEECEKDHYKINDKIKEKIIAYYYTIIGDTFHLIREIERNIDLLNYKDPLERNLLYIAARNGHVEICEYLINKGIEVNELQKTGSTALHGAAYYGHFQVVKLLLNYGAKTNIKNNGNHLPIDEAFTDEIKKLLKENEEDKIFELYQSLLSKNIAKLLTPISYLGSVVARKIVIKLNNLSKEYQSIDVKEKWISAWHGTNFKNLESIADIGLKPAGGLLKDGKENKVCVNHIGRDKTVDDIKDWANGIFVSPSIFYCAHPAYAKEISCNNISWKVFVEVKVKPNSFHEYKSTCPQYVPKVNEPKMLEYRIPAEKEKDVQVVSLTFVKSEFFDNAKNFEEGNIFLLSENN
jgi:hypothetical protein